MSKKKIAVLLPFKDHFTNSKAGSASIWVKDFNKNSSYKNNIYVVHDEESGATHASKNIFKQFLNIRSSNENIQLIDRFYIPV